MPQQHECSFHRCHIDSMCLFSLVAHLFHDSFFYEFSTMFCCALLQESAFATIIYHFHTKKTIVMIEAIVSIVCMMLWSFEPCASPVQRKRAEFCSPGTDREVRAWAIGSCCEIEALSLCFLLFKVPYSASSSSMSNFISLFLYRSTGVS